MTTEALVSNFYSRYQRAARIFYAPGRVNLIGEHTDYNEGFVLPFAIDRGTFVAAALRPDRRVRAHSTNLDSSVEFDLDASEPLRRGVWADYVQGMARALEETGMRLSGADLLISSDLPTGAGLSSSAALGVSTGKALCEISAQAIEPMTLVRAAHRTELEYVGTQSGIMDQYVATFGKKGCCLLIDCRSLEAKAIPLDLGNLTLIVSDTGVKHELASTAYNQRRQECVQGVELTKSRFPDVRSLRDLTPEQFGEIENVLPPNIRRRCRHVITENKRTLIAAGALTGHDLQRVGLLMNESHHSLRMDYEVSIPELDLLVETAQMTDGVLGSRMTGGGFGGCTITLVRLDTADAYMDSAREAYRETFSSEPGFMTVWPSDGAREIVVK